MAITSTASLPAALCCDQRYVPSPTLTVSVNASLRTRTPPSHPCTSGRATPMFRRSRNVAPGMACCAVAEDKENLHKERDSSPSYTAGSNKDSVDADTVTRKWGLEAGLWKVLTSEKAAEGGAEEKGKGSQAKELLARYGGAYLATSITLSAISISLCYALISAGVDVPALLDQVGIHTDSTGTKVGTFALAYAAHKASSPIRFPPTVALTPVVAGWFGKKGKKSDNSEASTAREDNTTTLP